MLSFIKNRLRQNLFFVRIRLISRGENPNCYITSEGSTDICIDGYPRSANSFSVRMFRQANPDLNISHHTHSVANLKKALECKIPTIALIRNPEQAIVSSVIAHKNGNIDEEILRYISIYSWVESNLDKLVIADFEKLIMDFNSVIKATNYKYNAGFSIIKDVENADTQVKKDIEKRYDQLGQKKMSHIKPLPTSRRDKRRELLHDRVLQHYRFIEAKEIYNRIIKNMQN